MQAADRPCGYVRQYCQKTCAAVQTLVATCASCAGREAACSAPIVFRVHVLAATHVNSRPGATVNIDLLATCGW